MGGGGERFRSVLLDEGEKGTEGREEQGEVEGLTKGGELAGGAFARRLARRGLSELGRERFLEGEDF